CGVRQLSPAAVPPPPPPIHDSVGSGFPHHPNTVTESTSSSFPFGTGRRLLAGRPFQIQGTVTAVAAESGVTLLQCIEAAVGARVLVKRTPRRRVCIIACGEYQCQSGKRGSSEYSH